jgi:hypothetical protein
MVEAVLIIAFALVLFVYWLRYTVVLLLQEEQPSESPLVLGQLDLLNTHRVLRESGAGIALDPVHQALERDYQMLRYLLDHAAGLALRPLERSLLLFHYRLMRLWYRLTRKSSAPQARRALEQMATVLTHIAYKMGRRDSDFSRA